MSEKQYSVTLTEKQMEAVQIALHVRIDQCRKNLYGHPMMYDKERDQNYRYWTAKQIEAENALAVMYAPSTIGVTP